MTLSELIQYIFLYFSLHLYVAFKHSYKLYIYKINIYSVVLIFEKDGTFCPAIFFLFTEKSHRSELRLYDHYLSFSTWSKIYVYIYEEPSEFFYLVIYISLEIRLFNFYIVQLVSSEFSTNQRASNWHVYTQNNSVIDWSSKWENQQKLMNLILSRSDTV